ncbi:DNA-3-methyladenine glycosylase family protein [Anoxynatronum sibiricum]|uniref:DNA-3-methyladenine glycosylase family protein n=1 Tax=Anoxynatronum sibiricum TaxID=210623 RepID=UPI003CCCF59B
MKPVFRYGEKEVNYLKSRDRRLGDVIDRMGPLEVETMPDVFTALVFSIINQQVSSKAADTVWTRLLEITGTMTPKTILATDPEVLQKCGTTHKKISYIRGIADAVTTGQVDFSQLHFMSDQQVIKQLSSLHGIGPWTAEMLLLFSLHRYDVISYDDLAIRRAMMKLYDLDQLSKEQFQRYRKRYSPYGSVASLYLWELSVE